MQYLVTDESVQQTVGTLTKDIETLLNFAQNASENYKIDRMELLGFEFHLIDIFKIVKAKKYKLYETRKKNI